ncbi:RNA-binding protein [Pyrenophora tritici-repentis]|uniref:Splicing factor U2AF subunit n=2 Tax=Pyrenophora tritici-repentis TaxID=45151 RepID=A0A2W1FDF5_9PLEO|nr:RNA-binding proteins (RRM domain) [Pyrenophora tritici-repentis]KAI0572083.1 RNA-binding proteins (RRM domain) [Pyrenophora tritici-repentis]KAI0611072.1 RNA-binding proteins (RRM domain) [Pyrenophora tritici-repentis]KAI0619765.1 RNA-binding proteins (RRM domain) [Pyrenophora tritici-repentis]KAI1515794.1 RNA recognition motif [Pyrenophora tritici-repentis]
MNGDSYPRDGGRSSGSRNYSSRDAPRDRDDRGDRRRRRSRSPRHGGGGGGGGGSRRDYEVDTYSSSRDYREREREDTYARRERRDDRGERGGERGGWGDSYSRRDRPRDRDRDDDRGHRRERGAERNERGGDRFGGEDRRGGRGGRDGGFGGGRDRMRQQKEESPPFNKPREATPDLASFTNILQRPRRMTQWDIKPAGYENITAEQAKLSGMFPLPGAPRAAPMDPSKLAAFISPSAGTATAAALATSAAKQSKRLYVHNLPSGCTSQEIMEFFNNQLNGLNVVSGNDPCLSAHIATSKEYAALEFKAPEDATLALAMTGISMRDEGGAPDRSGLSIRRPKDYITPTADENAYPPGDEVSSVVKDSPNKLSIVNIPTYIEEEQIRELVETMGKLKAFILVKDTGTDQHRGIAFCEYADNEIIDAVIEGLNDIPLGDGNLKVSRATVGLQQSTGLDGGVGAISMLAGASAAENHEHSRVVCLMNMVTSDELLNDEEYEEIKEDIEEECGKYGPIVETKIPRPAGARVNLGVGKIYIKYQDTESAQKAIKALAGRQFSRRTVVATEFSEEGFDVDAW